MKAEETIDFHLKWAWQQIHKWYHAEAADFDGTMAIGYVLLTINTTEGTPSTKLGPKMGMEATSLVRVLKSMEQKGLICRKSTEEDKRKVIIYLTELGIERRKIAKEIVMKLNSELQAQLTKRELATFFKVMDKIHTRLQYLQEQKT